MNPQLPYKGLQPYEAGDQPFYFGRDEDLNNIVTNLNGSRVTVLYGSSGVGKSSLLNAGVLAKLRQDPDVVVAVFRNWQRPDFAQDLKESLIDSVRSMLAPDIKGFPTTEASLLAIMAACNRESGRRIVVVLDQFEEYFRYHPTGATTESFEEELALAMNNRSMDAGFLFSLRADALSSLAQLNRRIDQILANLYPLEHLDRQQAEQAIRKPLDVYNRSHPTRAMSIEDALVTSLLDQARERRYDSDGQLIAGDRIETSTLQLVLGQLWEQEAKSDSRALRLGSLIELGGVPKIVQGYLDNVLGRLSPSDIEVAAEILKHMVTPSGMRVAYNLNDIAKLTDRPSAQLEPVIGHLVQDRVLRLITASGQPPVYEVVHDVLAPAVRDWWERYHKAQETTIQRKRLFKWTTAALLTILALSISTGLAISYSAAASANAKIARANAKIANSNYDTVKAQASDLATALKEAGRLQQKAATLAKQADTARKATLMANIELRHTNKLLEVQKSRVTLEAGNWKATLQRLQAQREAGDLRLNAKTADDANNYNGAINLSQQAVIKYGQAGDLEGKAQALTFLGIIYAQHDQNQRAKKALRQAVALFEALPKADQDKRIGALLALGTVVAQTNTYEGEKYVDKALEITRKTDSVVVLIPALEAKLLIYAMRKDVKNLKLFVPKAVNIVIDKLNQIKPSLDSAYMLKDLAAKVAGMDLKDARVKALKRAVQMFEQVKQQDNPDFPNFLDLYAEALEKNGESDEANKQRARAADLRRKLAAKAAKNPNADGADPSGIKR